MFNPVSILRQHIKIEKSRRKINSAITSDKPIVLVYQMGKVASSSIYHSLLNYPEFCHVFHTHILSSERIEARHKQKRHSLLNPDKRNLRSKDLLRYIIVPRYQT